jgi:hypothetical protein
MKDRTKLAQYLADYILEEMDRGGKRTELITYITNGIEAFEAGAHDGQQYAVAVAQQDTPQPLYVCINTAQELPSYTAEKFYVLGEDGCAYTSINDIVRVQNDAVDDGLKITKTAIYRLVPVTDQALTLARASVASEDQE